MPKLKDTDAERLACCVLEELGYEAWRQEASAGLVKFKKKGKDEFFQRARDIYGCVDVVAKADVVAVPTNQFSEPEGVIAGGPKPVEWYVQLTTSKGKSDRKKKLEASKWHATMLSSGLVRVSIWTHESVQDPLDFRRRRHFFRVEDLLICNHPEKSYWKVRGTISTDRLQRTRKESRAKMTKFLTTSADNPFKA